MKNDSLIEKLQECSKGEYCLSEDDALKSFEEVPLPVLFKMADAMRVRLNSNVCTFIIDRNINYTNICEARCRFCAFSRDEGDEGAYSLTQDEVLARVGEAVDQGATQIMLQGGLYKNTGLSYIRDLFAAIKKRYPGIVLHSLSAPEIEYFSRMEKIPVREVLKILKDSGLDSLPGAGAEILVDEVRAHISPKKINSEKWLRVHELAHRLNLFSTATMVIGHVEKPIHRVRHLSLIRGLQNKTQGFKSFILWIFHPGKTHLGGVKTSSSDYLRTLAISRLFLNNIKHVQASWLTVGKQIGQLALHAGADDLGSIMIEENVVRATGFDFVSMKVDEMVNMIRGAGRVPAQRSTDFSIIKYH